MSAMIWNPGFNAGVCRCYLVFCFVGGAARIVCGGNAHMTVFIP